METSEIVETECTRIYFVSCSLSLFMFLHDLFTVEGAQTNDTQLVNQLDYIL
jgi:hypothetical protein